jgi:hypothetical protein
MKKDYALWGCDTIRSSRGLPSTSVLSNVFIYWGVSGWWLWRRGRHVAIAIIITITTAIIIIIIIIIIMK